MQQPGGSRSEPSPSLAVASAKKLSVSSTATQSAWVAARRRFSSSALRMFLRRFRFETRVMAMSGDGAGIEAFAPHRTLLPEQ